MRRHSGGGWSLPALAPLLGALMQCCTLTASLREVQVQTPQEFRSALADQSVEAVHVLQDLDLTADFPAWESLDSDVVISRNLSIYGSLSQTHDQYPALDFGWWNNTGGQQVAHGVRLGPDVALVVSRILFKKASGMLPEFMFGGAPTSRVIVYDCLKHTYAGAPPAFAVAAFKAGVRPPDAPGGPNATNSLVVLPSGFCRAGPQPPLCWQEAYLMVDVAMNTSTFPRVAMPDGRIMVLIYGTAVVLEEVVDALCLQQYYASKGECVNVVSQQLQVQEAATASGWLGSPATPAQLEATAQGLLALPPIPEPADVPPWLLDNPPPSPAPSDQGSSKATTIGLAVGLGVGIPALILAIGTIVWAVRRRNRRQNQHEVDSSVDIEDGSGMKAISDDSVKGHANGEAQDGHDGALPGSTVNGNGTEALKADVTAADANGKLRAAAVAPTAEKGKLPNGTGGWGMHEGEERRRSALESALESGTEELGGDTRSHAEPGSTGSAPADASLATTTIATTSLPTSTNTGAPTSMHTGPPSLADGSPYHPAASPSCMVSTGARGALLQLGHVITDSSPVASSINLQVSMEQDVVLGQAIGSGAMGTVYCATYKERQVAVKVFAQGADLSSFGHEISILGRTSHPNVVALLGACFTPQHVALIEELCDGSLEQLMYGVGPAGPAANGPAAAAAATTAEGGAEGGAEAGAVGQQGPPQQSMYCNLPKVSKPLPLSLVLSIALEVANGLAYLHPTVIHRDLKPANILLVSRPGPGLGSSSSACSVHDRRGSQEGPGSSGSATGGPGSSGPKQQPDSPGSAAAQPVPYLQAKLSDFGLSRMRDAMTIVTQRPYCGTVPYMAPECFNRQWQAGLTHKCDIFSFGVVLWELLHGARPWWGYSPAEVLYQVAVQNTRPPILLAEDRCPRQLKKLLMRCWDQDPHRRPSALELVRELAFLQRQLGLAGK